MHTIRIHLDAARDVFGLRTVLRAGIRKNRAGWDGAPVEYCRHVSRVGRRGTAFSEVLAENADNRAWGETAVLNEQS
jgi:hypothetical protein